MVYVAHGTLRSRHGMASEKRFLPAKRHCCQWLLGGAHGTRPRCKHRCPSPRQASDLLHPRRASGSGDTRPRRKHRCPSPRQALDLLHPWRASGSGDMQHPRAETLDYNNAVGHLRLGTSQAVALCPRSTRGSEGCVCRLTVLGNLQSSSATGRTRVRLCCGMGSKRTRASTPGHSLSTVEHSATQTGAK